MIDRAHVVADLRRGEIRVEQRYSVVQREGRGNLEVKPVVIDDASRVVIIGGHPIQPADDVGPQRDVALGRRPAHRVTQSQGAQPAKGAADRRSSAVLSG